MTKRSAVALINTMLPGAGFILLRRWPLAVANMLGVLGALLFIPFAFPPDLSLVLVLVLVVVLAGLSGAWAMREAVRMGVS